MKKAYLIEQGMYFGEAWPKAITTTKAKAFKWCRQQGYRFNKRDGIFENDSTQMYMRVRLIDVVDPATDPVS